MIVSPSEPFKLIFSLYQHEFLGYLLEPNVVKLTASGDFSLQSQSISKANIKDFANGLSKEQIKLIELSLKIQQDAIFKKYNKDARLKIADFFKKIFTDENHSLKEPIQAYVSNHKQEIFSQLKQENVFIMGSDGIPTWKKIDIVQDEVKVYFHFDRREDLTIYFPIIRCGDERVKFQFQNGIIVNDLPATLIIDTKMYIFDGNVDGKKLKPFLNKSNIEIPRKLEDVYYNKFIVPLIANFNVYATGFEITYEKEEFNAVLMLSEIEQEQKLRSLFDGGQDETSSNLLIELFFKYGEYRFRYDNFSDGANVYAEKVDDSWKFHKIKRHLKGERQTLEFIKNLGLKIKYGRTTVPKFEALEWISTNIDGLNSYPIEILQSEKNTNSYFLGYSNISLNIEEKNDWFDVHATVIFGNYEISFKKLRHYILNNIKEFELPNGQMAVIPEVWFNKYSELFENVYEEAGGAKLKKQMVGMVNLLSQDGIVTTMFSRRLQSLNNFEKIEEVELPQKFTGTLRPYQKAGYNWLNFLKEYRFGGCLADDMGLGKTVITLAFLQKIVEERPGQPSILVLPTSLIYNWKLEAQKFTPEMRVMIHFGGQRSKDAAAFGFYDLVITSYGVLRMDIDFIKQFPFNYAILDESQSIKNASSANFRAVMQLHTKNRLILTGTPLENSTLDLWSQMSFINPGLLGSLNSFKYKFHNLIEKEKDENALSTLLVKIKPFMLRRNKKQVASDLPEKIESVVYCEMTEEQEKIYEETKSFVRNQLLDLSKGGTLKRSSIVVLQGLSKLRQLANHPAMLMPGYEEGSGKIDEISDRLKEAISEGSKTLIFSQFVKHLHLISEFLKKENIPFLYLDGGTKNRIELVEQFQKEDSEKVFLISLKAGGVGLNLTAAENVFILDPWWNPAIEAQAIDRAHRIGQTKTVFSYKFITQNTIEEKILELQNTKRRLFNDLILEEEGFYKSLDTDDILSLLE